jgi:hypothetical protein
MDIDTIINFLSETNDKLYPFNRTYKLLKNLSDISEYIKINLKSNIKLEELGKELKVNIILINDKLEFNCINLNYDKYICLIQHKNCYEFAYIKQNNSKEIYIFTKKDIQNINLNLLQINNDDDDDEDYKEITETYDKPCITIDESEVHTEEYSSVNDILKKELGNISDSILEETIEIVSEKEEEIVNKSNDKIVNGIKIPNELTIMDEKILKKLLKGDLIKYFLKENTKISQNQINKYTKDKLIEMIKK